MSKLNFRTCALLFLVAITTHNIEEALFLPSWSNPVGIEVSSSEFTFAVVFLTVLAYLSFYFSIRSGKKGLWTYFFTGYALAMFLNVFFPHVLTSILVQEYAPGTGTAVLMVLPTASLVLYKSIQGGYVDKRKFYVIGPIVVLTMAASVPLLFAMWRAFGS
ncbi:HXXEE domain-containing protein [Prosthecochloris sp. SCSIO W1101]|uniref:HXXEE domain-containing protein n=1 Tax=Prosthecochloris sp. SCSIO W1101 TaxID=2992242 RepID=UPI00223D0AE0|nr:HXXEE domain-containing protein [Prosthecochloris sp. SCSIO W1101]UZJ40233.1 HXXEE domain-containing protein [Prosthecochloris sp. SCSIO W1101]